MRAAYDPSGDAFQGRAPQATSLGPHHVRNERRTWIVAAICAAALAAQITGGLLFHSMALTASGLHMAAHVAAMLTAAGAYGLARRHSDNPRFAFGTAKFGDLAAFANAMLLAVTAILIGVESVERLIAPVAVDYASALPLQVAGLAVTLVCVWLLTPQGGGDLNLSAAHLHLSADALVGLLAILGLLAGQRLRWHWADPLAGLAGAFLVAQFAVSLIVRATASLLDMNPSSELTADIRSRLEADGGRVIDLRLWRVGPGQHAAVATVVSDAPGAAEAYHARLKPLETLSHVTIEVRSSGRALA